MISFGGIFFKLNKIETNFKVVCYSISVISTTQPNRNPVFGTPDEDLALVFDLLREKMNVTQIVIMQPGSLVSFISELVVCSEALQLLHN